MAFLLLVLVIAVGLIIVIARYYNDAQGLSQSVRETYANVTVVLKKRLDLVNKLIDIARSYSDHEKLTFIAVVEGESLGALAQASMRADGAVTQLNSLSRNYPELKANDTFQQLMRDLTKIESEVQNRREIYNSAVKKYNVLCTTIPFVFIASSLGFSQAPYFDVENADSLNQIKDFTTDDGTILRQKLSNAGTMVLNTTKSIGTSIEQNGRVLIERGKNEMKKHSEHQSTEDTNRMNGSEPQ